MRGAAAGLAVLLLFVGCRTRLRDVQVFDMSASPDLGPTLCHGVACGSTQLCVEPCHSVLGCEFHVPDAGCPDWFVKIDDCGSGFGAGCAFDRTPRCVDMPAICTNQPSCDNCKIDVCPICKGIENRRVSCECF